MIVTLIRQHDRTKGPEAHQTYIFNLQGENPGENHSFSVFTYQNEQYRAFRSYAQVKPIVKDGKTYAVAQVVAVKCTDEAVWAKKGKQGELSPEIKAKLARHIAR